MGYRIITDATADLSLDMLEELSSVGFIPMEVRVGENSYLYGLPDTLTADQFYDLQRSGSYAATSQISPAGYCEFWRPYLELGLDILYLCFSSGMSGTLQSSRIAAEELAAEYPDRTIRIVDTCCASVGEGLLVYEAARLQESGMPLEELGSWLDEHKMNICHWFTVDQFDHLLRGGRVTAAAAAVGTMLQIKPLLRVDEQGKLMVMQKPRGRKKAIAAQIAQMETGWMPELSKTVLLGHGGNVQIAWDLYESVRKHFPEADIHIAEIGPIIGAHTGPDMLALTYWGSKR